MTTLQASFLLWLAYCNADLPCHCLHTEVQGTWKFHLSPTYRAPIHKDQSRSDPSQGLGYECGHPLPDNKEWYFSISTSKIVSPVQKTLEVTLSDPDVAKDRHGNTGFWTMIYDEGFEVQLNGWQYFAFSKYHHSSDPEDNAPKATKDTAGYHSECEKTFAGWYHNENLTTWGCYYGIKQPGPLAPNKARSVEEQPRPVPAELQQFTDSFWQGSFIERLNAHPNASWTARLYPQFAGLSIEELAMHAGGLSQHGPARRAVKDNRPDHEKYEDLPTHWDWRNVNGVNYMSPVRTQGSCGSCYAIAATAMLESRIRIRSKNKLQPLLSPQDVVSCSFYSQGCDGGFPYLVGKYLNDFGVVEEDCFPYEKRVPCTKRCPRPKRFWRAENYHYVGGFYGGCNEVDMMKEIYHNGPIVIGFEAGGDLFYYNGGIYSASTDEAFLEVSRDAPRPWEHTNHAVLAVGWGVEKGTKRKYWIAKNTWGPQWGEDGFFRIERGVDESAFESMAVAADAVLLEEEEEEGGHHHHHHHHHHHIHHEQAQDAVDNGGDDAEEPPTSKRPSKHRHHHRHKTRPVDDQVDD